MTILAIHSFTVCGSLIVLSYLYLQEIATRMFEHWKSRFDDILDDDDSSISVVKLSGDTTADLKLLEQGNLIVATAIHWDSLSRRWKQRKNVQNVALYIADELHLLGGSEGPTLEIVVSRARYVASQLDRKVRIVGLSSSLANAKDAGDWLGAPQHSIYNFAPDVRPVPLEVHIHGFEANHFGSRLLAMSKPAYSAIVGHSPDKPAIIFVPSRKQAQLTAIDLITYAAAGGSPDRFLRVDVSKMADVLETIKEPALSQTLAHGVGFIHEGLNKSDRERVESLYRDGVIGVLVLPRNFCWSTPAPAHLVVVMDTVYYEGREHRFVDYSITDIMQMLGIACRPLMDEVGKCVVLCYAPKKEYLKRLLHDALPIESHLDQFLHDHM
jgi:pre-mRNA-splicing helicase BRR2